MSRRPSPLFMAALDAHHALQKTEEKLANVRRRDLSRSECYALDLVIYYAEALEDRYARKIEDEVVTEAART